LEEIRKYTKRIRIKRREKKAPSSANRREKTTLGQIKQSRPDRLRPFVRSSTDKRKKKREEFPKIVNIRGQSESMTASNSTYSTQDIHINQISIQIGKERSKARKRERRRRLIWKRREKNAYAYTQKVYHGEPMSIRLNTKIN